MFHNVYPSFKRSLQCKTMVQYLSFFKEKCSKYNTLTVNKYTKTNRFLQKVMRIQIFHIVSQSIVDVAKHLKNDGNLNKHALLSIVYDTIRV